tara:strand:- start:1482 stop:1676 length:195 start_codon:yes stop_codon:yes gene_type:complete
MKERNLLLESVVVGITTLSIGSALMLVPIEGIWFAYFGTFLIGFIAHYGFEFFGLNEWFCKEVM